MYRYPCPAASFSQCSRASSKSRPWKTTSAPRARIDSTFTGLARSGMQIIARTPNSSAAYATDWPWLPVEAAITPRRRSSAVSWLTRFTPPRTLNAPTGWWFSCLTRIRVPVSASRAG